MIKKRRMGFRRRWISCANGTPFLTAKGVTVALSFRQILQPCWGSSPPNSYLDKPKALASVPWARVSAHPHSHQRMAVSQLDFPGTQIIELWPFVAKVGCSGQPTSHFFLWVIARHVSTNFPEAFHIEIFEISFHVNDFQPLNARTRYQMG